MTGRGDRRRRGAARRPPREAAREAASPSPPPRAGRLWAFLGALAIVPLLWASRSPTLGVPVADDYLFLSTLARGRPDFFGPMGAAYYWRPLSRQLYYLLVGPWLIRAPWLGTLVAALLLLALYLALYRIARRGLSPPLAAAVAAFPLLSEPARVFLAWPSAAQHLLAAVFAAFAVERALAGRIVAASAAALLALLSNEAAFLVLPALPAAAWLRTRSRAELARATGAALAVAAIWVAGYTVARAHGAALPRGEAGSLWLPYLAVLVQATVSQMGYEGLAAGGAKVLLAGVGLLLAAGLALSIRRASRRRIARAAPALLGGLAWFVLGVAPLVFVLPDWNAWRATVAALGLGLALTGWLGLAEPALAALLVGVRLVTLLLGHGAPPAVTDSLPGTASSFSFARLVRLQRIVESTRRTLNAGAPSLPSGGIVRYWQLPRLAEVGFSGDNALRVWYRDTTLSLRFFREAAGIHEPLDALVEFEANQPWPAALIQPRALHDFQAAFAASQEGRLRTADSLMSEASRAQPGQARRFLGNLAENRAKLAWRLGAYERADSLNRVSYELQGETPAFWAMTAHQALRRQDMAAARSAVRRCLELDPSDEDGIVLARLLDLRPTTPGP